MMAEKPAARKTIYYVRHGESVANASIAAALQAGGLANAGEGEDAFSSEQRRAVSYNVMNDPAAFVLAESVLTVK